MREIAVRDVFHRVIGKRGYQASTGTLTAPDRANVADYVNIAIKRAWEAAYWPEIMKVEQRQFRETWSDSTNYVTGDEVFHTDADGDDRYWVSLQDSNINKDPDTETLWWEEVGSDFVRNIDLRQSWETQDIGMLDIQEHIFDRDPRIFPDTEPLLYCFLEGDAIYVRPEISPVKPWIKFRPPVPRFSWTEWNSATAYGIGDLVYQDLSGTTVVGETFIALTSSTNKEPYTQTDEWKPVPFPELFQDYAIHWAAAEDRTEDEGRSDQFEVAGRIYADLQDSYEEGQGKRQRAVYQAGR